MPTSNDLGVAEGPSKESKSRCWTCSGTPDSTGTFSLTVTMVNDSLGSLNWRSGADLIERQS